jgi:predicted kinase
MHPDTPRGGNLAAVHPPRLVLVSGLPAAGKTTIAHALGTRLPCPVISRDEIKEGLVHARGGGTPEWGAPIANETFALFYRIVGELVRSGCSVVAEAAYLRDLSQEVMKLVAHADACVVHCQIDRDVAVQRFIERAASDPLRRILHPDAEIVAAMERAPSNGSGTSQWSWGFRSSEWTPPMAMTPRLTTSSLSAVDADHGWDRGCSTRLFGAQALPARRLPHGD